MIRAIVKRLVVVIAIVLFMALIVYASAALPDEITQEEETFTVTVASISFEVPEWTTPFILIAIVIFLLVPVRRFLFTSNREKYSELLRK